MITSNDHRITFLNTIRSKAGIERHAASEEILLLMSGNSLLRKSSEALLVKSVSSSPVSSDGTRTRASSERIPRQNSRRRQSTMSLPSDLEFLGPVEEESVTTPSQSDSLSESIHKPSSSLGLNEVLDHHDNDQEHDLPISCDSSSHSHTQTQTHCHFDKIISDPHLETIPLFEHFLVIGASVDVSADFSSSSSSDHLQTSIDISNEMIEKQTRLMRGRLRNTLDTIFRRGKTPERNNEITSVTLARQTSVKRGSSHESDFVSGMDAIHWQ
jgi:hypothetical protein